MTYQEAEELALELLEEVPVNFRLTEGKAYVAQCEFVGGIARTINLSKRFVPYLTPELLREAILHEVAHVHTGEAHDEAWRRECEYLGIPARRRIPLPIEAFRETSRWLLTCEECGDEWFRDRVYKHLDYLCSKCGIPTLVLRNPYLVKS